MVSGDFWQTLKECGLYDIITKAKQKIITGKGGLCKAYNNEEEMKMVSQMTVGMKNFAEQYGIAIHDPTLIRRYRMYQDARRDEATRIAVAEQKATTKTKAEMAKGFKEKGVDPAIIASVTELSLAEINAL